MTEPFWLEWCRGQFPALARKQGDRYAAFLDGPAGTQVPQAVIDAIGRYLVECNANHGGKFATSRQSDAWLDEVHRAVADFLGTDDPDCIQFGPNMTTLTFAFSRALARTWRPGDEIVVTRSEHEANFTPWVAAARDAGATIRYVDLNTDDCTLDLADFRAKIHERTRLVAVGGASNATGTRHPIETICAWAREVGAVSFIDAVHLAPHERLQVHAIGCDALACSAYKFCGPHIGILWARRSLLENVTPYKLRTSPHTIPGRWMTGTQSHEGLAGVLAAIEYWADFGRRASGCGELSRRAAIDAAYAQLIPYERSLGWRLIDGLQQVPGIRIWGITDPARAQERVPTVAFTHPNATAAEIAERLGDAGYFVWHGNYYALPLTERLGLEPEGMVRVGLVHYNTPAEVDGLLSALQSVL